LFGPADQRRWLNGQIRWPRVERVERREVLFQPRGDELEDPFGSGEISQPVWAEVAQVDVLERFFRQQVVRGLRDEHLPAVRRGADAGGPVHPEADIALGSRARLTRVDAHANSKLLHGRLWMGNQCALGVQRRSHRLASGWEGDEERVALRIDLVTAPADKRLPEQPAVLVERPFVTIPELEQQPGRALDVGEEEAHCPGRPRVGLAKLERRVVVEDLALEPLQGRPRIDPQLFGEQPPALLVSVEGIVLASGAIEGQHQLRAQPFAERVGGNEALELGDELRVTAEHQLHLEPLLRRRQTKLLEPEHVLGGERVVAEVRERVTTKQGESSTQQFGTACGVVLSVRLVDERLEAADVDALAVEPEQVSRRSCLDRVGSEQLAQSGDVTVQRRVRRLRRRLAPERSDELVARNHVVHVEQEKRQQSAVLRSRRSDHAFASDDLEWAEEAEIEGRSGHSPSRWIVPRGQPRVSPP
jgi:hypothetical protein